MHGDYGREATSSPRFFDHAGTDPSGTAIAWALSAPSVGKGVGRRFFYGGTFEHGSGLENE